MNDCSGETKGRTGRHLIHHKRKSDTEPRGQTRLQKASLQQDMAEGFHGHPVT